MLLKVKEIADLYVDAIALHQNRLVFLSLWGRDTSVKEFFARLTLSPGSQGGLRKFLLIDPDSKTKRFEVQAGDVNNLEKLTGRMPKQNLFGDSMVHTWIYDPITQQPDKVAMEAMYLCKEINHSYLMAIWSLIKTICPIPLLDDWRPQILDVFNQNNWFCKLDGFGIEGVHIKPDMEKLQQKIKYMIVNNLLK